VVGVDEGDAEPTQNLAKHHSPRSIQLEHLTLEVAELGVIDPRRPHPHAFLGRQLEAA